MTERDLPGTVPIFPLTGVLLLPRARLPLHIFEPRYRAMTRDALEGDRMIGMIQPRLPNEADMGDGEAEPPVCQVGCVGHIHEVEELSDGRFNLILVGVSRFRVVSELPGRNGYRRVLADYSPFEEDPYPVIDETGIDRPRLLMALKAFLEVKGLKADWRAVGDARAEALIHALAMLCPFDPSEKQALLESPTLVERSRVLTALCEMGALASQQGGDDETPASRH